MPAEYIEYSPCAVQCQAYTATPANGASPFAMSVIRRVNCNGTPSATPPPEIELRMSERTMPDCSSTSGPFDPSPG